jgi:hypothetical protein
MVMKDRFSEAFAELTDKNPYVCTTCTTEFGHPTIEHIEGRVDLAGGYEMGTRTGECILFCDPMPFGD